MNWFNQLSTQQSAELLHTCCGSSRWVASMVASRPFRNSRHLLAQAEEAWSVLTREDYLEAFAAHPQIGDVEALRSKFSTDKWAGREQQGTAGAAEHILSGLAEANHQYKARFGYIFIICATGKSASAMLDALRDRLNNLPETELVVAAAQQAQITRLRLQKMLDEHTP